MTVPGVGLGTWAGPFDACLGAARLGDYAQATKDPSPRVQAGEAAAAGAIVTTIWEAQEGGRAAAVPAAFQRASKGGVHGEHEFVMHRPIVPGEPLRIRVEGYGARPAGRNSAVTLHYVTRDAREQVIAEQWWTTVFFGVTCERQGRPAPEHAFPEGARDRPVGTWDVDVDEEMARRYAEVSGDWTAHHFDVEAARSSGFDRTFLHGLCTIGLCAQGVAALAAGGDPERVRRIAVRFAAPTFLGEQLHVRVYDAGPLGYAFEADSRGASVITHGRAELR
jgi:acyl dehydratase